MTPHQKLVAKYDRDNKIAALAILRDVQKYGGEDAGLVQWARAALRADQMGLELEAA